MKKIITILLLVSALFISYSCQTNSVTNKTDKQSEKPIENNDKETLTEDKTEEAKEVTRNINPTVATNDQIIEEVNKLQEEGKLKDVQIRESFPVQITATGSEEILNSLIDKARDNGEKRLFINSKLVDCVGSAPQKCLQIREDDSKDWQFFYGKINGFEFEEGYKYQIKIKETRIENPPADASSIKTELIEVIKKEKAE